MRVRLEDGKEADEGEREASWRLLVEKPRAKDTPQVSFLIQQITRDTISPLRHALG